MANNWDKIKAERKKGKSVKELAEKYEYSYSYTSRKLSDVKPEKLDGNRNADGTFKKGESGNPVGRPKKNKCIPDMLRQIGDEVVKKDKTKLEVVLRKVYEEAEKGRSWAINFIADRTEGKPKETVEQIDTSQIQEIKMI